MLAESGISVAPLERPRAPDAKHMAPASSNTCSRARRTEPVAVVEKSASSDDTDTDEDNDNDNNDNNNDDANDSNTLPSPPLYHGSPVDSIGLQ